MISAWRAGGIPVLPDLLPVRMAESSLGCVDPTPRFATSADQTEAGCARCCVFRRTKCALGVIVGKDRLLRLVFSIRGSLMVPPRYRPGFPVHEYRQGPVGLLELPNAGPGVCPMQRVAVESYLFEIWQLPQL